MVIIQTRITAGIAKGYLLNFRQNKQTDSHGTDKREVETLYKATKQKI